MPLWIGLLLTPGQTAHNSLCRSGKSPDLPFHPIRAAEYPKVLIDAYFDIVKTIAPFLDLFTEDYLRGWFLVKNTIHTNVE